MIDRRPDQVAELMANGDRIDARGRARPITAEEIGRHLGLNASYVRAIQCRIRSQLGSQAI